jgi:hypothetical protein
LAAFVKFIKREMQERDERKKKEEIKKDIRPSQLQMIIIFDRKLRLRYYMQPPKAYDEIYKDNRLYCYGDF